ncbi:MAG: Transmembrane protein YfcA [Olavius algarvensis Delta 4 endosymbiont]|nr:MAG: Transmembrane protein YfcA [Olavius algarvensis Delta 4 endosymbiont]
MEASLDTLSLFTGLFLWSGGFLAGFVDSIAGGGGIISLPVLLSVGIPPHQALGTNKLQGSFGSFTAAVNYTRKGLVDFKTILPGILFTAIGAGLGTIAIQLLSAAFLKHVIPLLLAAVFFTRCFHRIWAAGNQYPKCRRSFSICWSGLRWDFTMVFLGREPGLSGPCSLFCCWALI